MAYNKFNIYSGVKISEKVLSVFIVIGLIAISAVMVIGNRIGFTASFQSNGEIIGSQRLHYGEKVKEPIAPKRAGYKFNGWYMDAAATQKYDFSAVDISNDITIYAGWKKADSQAGAVPIRNIGYEIQLR